MSILGRAVTRVEDERFLTGHGRYVSNTESSEADTIWIAFARSPIAHGRLLDVDTSEALSTDGVITVFTGRDIDLPPIPPVFGSLTHPVMVRPIIATDTVRFVGEIIAVVVATSETAAIDGIEAIVEDIDPLDAVIDPIEAVSTTVHLFEGTGTNVTYAGSVASTGVDDDTDLFADCEVVVERVLVNQRLAPCPMEPRAAVCVPDAGRLRCFLTTQTPQLARDSIAAQLRVPSETIHVIAGPDVGGGFGPKDGWYPEDILTAWVARKMGKTTRWHETRSESMLGLYHGRGQVQTLRLGGSSDGRLAAYELEIVQDAGAYPSLGAWLPNLTMMMAPGTYDIQRVRARSQSVVTNTTPVNAYRGAGRPEATAAIERMIDIYARRVGLDPIEVRRQNLIAPFTAPRENAVGTVYDSGDYASALDSLLQHLDLPSLRAEQAARRDAGAALQLGIGVSTYVEVTGGPQAGSEHARVSVADDGKVTVYTGTSPHGQGHETSWAMLTANELGVDMGDVTVVHGDTDLVPEGVGTYGSRSLQLGGGAVVKVSRDLIEEARRIAAQHFEADTADVAFDTERAAFHVAGTPSITMSWPDVAAKVDGPLSVYGKYDAKSATFPSGAHLAVVEVDVETGYTRLQRFVSADDAGRIINPLIASGQRHGGIAQGVAQALYEAFTYDEFGNPQGGNLAEYAFPSAAEMPNFELLDIATPTDANVLGVKGIGESGTIGATPAVHNAVLDAVSHLGVDHIDMPLTPFKVWSALNNQ